ncbi:unnamed protein product, partial [Laminaria digitata]
GGVRVGGRGGGEKGGRREELPLGSCEAVESPATAVVENSGKLPHRRASVPGGPPRRPQRLFVGGALQGHEGFDQALHQGCTGG